MSLPRPPACQHVRVVVHRPPSDTGPNAVRKLLWAPSDSAARVVTGAFTSDMTSLPSTVGQADDVVQRLLDGLSLREDSPLEAAVLHKQSYHVRSPTHSRAATCQL